MLDGSYWFECQCFSDEHTIKFVLDKEDRLIYGSMFLNTYRNIFKRIWIGIKYVFNYRCRFGHWDEWIMREDDIENFQKMLDNYRHIVKEKNTKKL